MGESSEVCFIERRRFPRYHCAGEVEILQRERCWGWGRAKLIGCGGCYIETIRPLPINTEAQLRLTIADTQLGICAKVVSNNPLVGMGMAFIVESPEQWNKLSHLVARIALVTPNEGQLHMQAALHHLQQAQEELQEAMYDKAEHRETALQLTGNAIDDVRQVSVAAAHNLETIDPSSAANGVVQ